MKYLILALICSILVLTSCSLHEPPKSDPEQFKTGDVVKPPIGCTEGRIRGVDC